jgi:hypothetical protein
MAAIVVLFIIYLAATPFITVYQIRTAAENQDTAELSEHVEFSSIRQSFKDQLNTTVMSQIPKEMTGNPLAALGTAFAGVVVDKTVDAYVTPVSIIKIMSGEDPRPQINDTSNHSPARKPLADASMSYESLDKFVVTAKNHAGEEERFILRRRGLDWKLTEIIIPLEP